MRPKLENMSKMEATLKQNTFSVQVPRVDLKRFRGIVKAMGWGIVSEPAVANSRQEITPAMRRQINKARKEYAEGKTITCRTPQEMQQFFDSL